MNNNYGIKHHFLYLIVFVTGAAVLIIEILGTRVLAPFFGSTIYVWSSLITVTLGALSAGYFAGGKIIDKKPSFKILYSVIFLAGVFLFLPMKIDQLVLPLMDTFGLRFGPLFAALALFAVPLFLLGMVGPMAVRLIINEINESGSYTGRIFAASTVGSVLGAFLAGFILLPQLSLTSIFNLLGLLLTIISFVGFLNHRFLSRRFLILMGLAISTAFLPKYYANDQYPSEILHHEQGYYSDLKVIAMGKLKCLTTDGATQSCSMGEKNDVPPLFYELADIFNKTDAKSLLVLGGGAGNLVAGGINPGIRIDHVEIDPGVVSLGQKYLGFKTRAGDAIYIDDARSFLRKTSKKYDAIFMDLARGIDQPYYMYSKEVFETLRQRLADDGLIVMNILGGIGEKDASAASVVRTARSVFPTVIPMTNSPDTNVTYYIFISPGPDYEFAHDPSFGVEFVRAELDESLGIVLSDEYNPFDYLFKDKYRQLLYLNRVFAGLKGVFSL